MGKKIEALWQTPPREGETRYDYLGYVVFNSNHEGGEVLTARVGDPSVEIGENFWRRLGLSPSEICRLHDGLLQGGACWVISRLGVGILCAGYDVWMGVLIYLHIHDDPKALRRLIYRGRVTLSGILPPPLGGLRTHTVADAQDDAVAQRFQIALGRILALRELSLPFDARKGISLLRLHELLESMARLTGCSLSLALEEVPKAHEREAVLPQVMCPAPRMTETILFFWLCMLGRDLERGTVVGKISVQAVADGWVPRVTLQVYVPKRKLQLMVESPWLMAVDHFICRAEINGVATDMTTEPGAPSEACETMCLRVGLVFGRDPAKDPPAGLKNGLALVYDHEK